MENALNFVNVRKTEVHAPPAQVGKDEERSSALRVLDGRPVRVKTVVSSPSRQLALVTVAQTWV